MSEEATPDSPCMVLFSSDLMLISSTGGAARAAGLKFSSISRLADLAEKVADGKSILCLDLSSAEGDPSMVAQVIPTRTLACSIAFGPHVHTAKLELARRAGFASVVSRGQFVAKIHEEIAKALSTLKSASV